MRTTLYKLFSTRHLRALTGAKNVIKQAAHYLMLDDKTHYSAKTPLFDVVSPSFSLLC